MNWKVFWREFFKTFIPMMTGFMIVIPVTIVATPTKWTYLFWGFLFVFFIVLSGVVGWMEGRRK